MHARYDEMVFHKVMQKVDKSYLDEIKELQATRGDLQTEEERLMKQREQDLLRLQRERWARFAKNNEAAEQRFVWHPLLSVNSSSM